MDGDQVASLSFALGDYLLAYRDCFKRERTFGYLLDYTKGLMSDVDRKSIEPIALRAEVPPRTMQEFLSYFSWDEDRAEAVVHRRVADRPASGLRIGVLDGSGYPKQGDKTPGVQRQWCGQLGKKANCVVGQHLLWTDNDANNPFSCLLCSDLYLPKSWDADRNRCRAAHIPDHVVYRPKWRIAVEQLERAMGHGVRFDWVTFDEEYGSVPELWYELNRLGMWAIGEVRSNFRIWPTRPAYCSLHAAHASKRVDNVCRHSPVFTQQKWKQMKIKSVTRGTCVWQVKSARVHLVEHEGKHGYKPRPTDRAYWLIVARHPTTKEIKYFICNAPASADLLTMLQVAFARWHIEKWFERAKQEAGLDALEVRTYRSLIRHWLCSMIAMMFLTEQTTRLRGEKSEHHTRAGQPRGRTDRRRNARPVAPIAA